ncbi:hypothetical protein ABK040_008676 [Willaertia magna]
MSTDPTFTKLSFHYLFESYVKSPEGNDCIEKVCKMSNLIEEGLQNGWNVFGLCIKGDSFNEWGYALPRKTKTNIGLLPIPLFDPNEQEANDPYNTINDDENLEIECRSQKVSNGYIYNAIAYIPKNNFPNNNKSIEDFKKDVRFLAQQSQGSAVLRALKIRTQLMGLYPDCKIFVVVKCGGGTGENWGYSFHCIGYDNNNRYYIHEWIDGICYAAWIH